MAIQYTKTNASLRGSESIPLERDRPNKVYQEISRGRMSGLGLMVLWESRLTNPYKHLHSKEVLGKSCKRFSSPSVLRFCPRAHASDFLS